MIVGLEDLSPEDLVWQLTTASWATHAVRAMAVLELADHLAAGPRSIADLAEATGSHAPTLARLINVLVSLGLCARTDADQIDLTPAGQFLRRDVPGSAHPFMLGVMAPHFEQAMFELSEAVRTGQPVFARVHGLDFWDYLSAHPEAGARFDAAMSGGAEFAARLLSVRDLSEIDTLVDIGGGQGRLLEAVLTAMPNLRGVLFDQPQVVARAVPALTDAELGDRCAIVGGDFFVEVPPGGDAYVLASIIHDWPDEQAIQILRTCFRAMAPGARIWLLENVVKSDASDLWTQQLDLLMLTLFGAQERTAEEYQHLLEAAGFTDVTVTPTERAVCLIEGVRP